MPPDDSNIFFESSNQGAQKMCSRDKLSPFCPVQIPDSQNPYNNKMAVLSHSILVSFLHHYSKWNIGLDLLIFSLGFFISISKRGCEFSFLIMLLSGFFVLLTLFSILRKSLYNILSLLNVWYNFLVKAYRAGVFLVGRFLIADLIIVILLINVSIHLNF